MTELAHSRRLYYRVKEASQLMGIPVRTLYHLTETGQVPCRRLGTVILIPVDFVDPDPDPDPAPHQGH
jgi:excisionase family DNA binding protein